MFKDERLNLQKIWLANKCMKMCYLIGNKANDIFFKGGIFFFQSIRCRKIEKTNYSEENLRNI